MITKEGWANGQVRIVVKRIDIPELKDDCCIRVMDQRNRDAYDVSVSDGRHQNLENLSARLVARCLCDEAAKYTFRPEVAEGAAPSAAEIEQAFADGARLLGRWPTTVIERLYHECRKLNGMMPGAVDDAAKNSEPTSDASSSTD